MTGCNLVSAIRLPNNLFSDYAGTDVGSDLIILQRKSKNTSLSPREQNFIESRKLSNGISINNLFRDFSRVVQTHSKVDTDPYGKPAIVFTHEGGIDGIARDLGQMLKEDFARHLDLRHYRIYAHKEERKSTVLLDREENSFGFQDVLSEEQSNENGLSTVQQISSSSERYQPTQEDIESFSEFINESDRKLFSQRPPLPEDYPPKEAATSVPEQTSGGIHQRSLFDKGFSVSNEPTAGAKAGSVSLTPVITLYDLFGFSQEERSQVKKPKKKVKRAKPKVESEQALLFMDWREEMAYEVAQKREQLKQELSDANPT